MKLKDLTKTVSKYARKKKKGKKLDTDSIEKVLDKLKTKQKRVKKEYQNETAAKKPYEKEVKRLVLQQEVIKAQIKKAEKLLKENKS